MGSAPAARTSETRHVRPRHRLSETRSNTFWQGDRTDRHSRSPRCVHKGCDVLPSLTKRPTAPAQHFTRSKNQSNPTSSLGLPNTSEFQFAGPLLRSIKAMSASSTSADSGMAPQSATNRFRRQHSQNGPSSNAPSSGVATPTSDGQSTPGSESGQEMVATSTVTTEFRKQGQEDGEDGVVKKGQTTTVTHLGAKSEATTERM